MPASKIETFRSTATTQIPSMGIVRMSGDRALGDAIGGTARVFDAVAEYTNKKLDEKMAREVTIQAQDAVRSAGLNPKDLKDPYTTADKIYRDAALGTYAIGVEASLDENLNRMAVESKYNAGGFKAKADKYLEGMMGNLAPELKDPIQKAALGKINSEYASIARETQSKALAEARAAFATQQDKIAADIVNASPEERAALNAKLEASIAADPTNITAQGKRAALDEAQKSIVMQIGLRDAMEGDSTPNEVFERYEKAGIAVTPSVKQQVYSASMVEHNYQQTLYNMRKAEQQQAIDSVQENFYEQLMNDQGVDEGTALKLVSSTQQQMKEAGASSEDIFKFKATAMNAFYGSQIESKDVTAYIETSTESRDPNTPSIIKQAVREGAILPRTGARMMNEYLVATGDAAKSPEYRSYEATSGRQQFPLATEFTGLRPTDYSDPVKAEQAANDQIGLMKMRQEFSDMLNDPEKPVSAREAISRMKGLDGNNDKTEVTQNVPITVLPNTPSKIEVHSMLNDPEPEIKIYTPSGKNSQKVGAFRYKDINTLDTGTAIGRERRAALEAWGQGRWSKENAANRVKVMAYQNYLHRESGQPQETLPYKDDVIETIMKQYNLKESDLQ